MIEQLPIWLDLLFIASVIYTIAVFHFTNNRPIKITGFIIIWSVVHSLLSYFGFYQNTMSLPPRFALVVLPLLIMIVLIFKNKKKFYVQSNVSWQSSLIHIVRIPVEICLYYLYVYKSIPELMTFSGRNYDILAGLTAPIISYSLYKNQIGKKGFLLWNIISLCLLLFIVINAVLSIESPFQQFGFEQPNKAIAYFPYILLPATIVPLVIYTHLLDIFRCCVK